MLDLKIFKLYQQDDHNSHSQSSQSQNLLSGGSLEKRSPSSQDDDSMYSLRDILNEPNKFDSHVIFQIKASHNSTHNKSQIKYVYFKRKNINIKTSI